MERRTKPMPEDAHLRPPVRPDTLLVEEVDEVLARGVPNPEYRDAWLDARVLARQAETYYEGVGA
jgi:hypothetical protein